jgi:hypothetical protein
MSALRRSTKPIRAQRSKPRRGRLTDKKYIAWLAKQPCHIKQFAYVIENRAPEYSCAGRVTVHHIRDYGSPKNDRRAVPLCMRHHLHDFGPFSIERGRRQFAETFGFAQEAAIDHYNEQYEREAKR